MRLYIKTLPRRSDTIDAECADTISDIKQKISDKMGIPTCIMILIFAGKVLEDERTFVDCLLSKESTLHLIEAITRVVVISIQLGESVNSCEKKISFQVNYFHTIEDIKYEVQDRTGIPCESIHLYINEIELENCQSVLDVGIHKIRSIKASIDFHSK